MRVADAQETDSRVQDYAVAHEALSLLGTKMPPAREAAAAAQVEAAGQRLELSYGAQVSVIALEKSCSQRPLGATNICSLNAQTLRHQCMQVLPPLASRSEGCLHMIKFTITENSNPHAGMI